MLMQCSIFSFLIFHPSVQCIFIFPLSLSLFISLTLQHTLGCQAAIQTSSEEKLSFLSNTLQSIVSPYVVNKREDTGENHIADDCKWCTTRDTWKRRRKRRRKRSLERTIRLSVGVSCSPVALRDERQTCPSADDGQAALLDEWQRQLRLKHLHDMRCRDTDTYRRGTIFSLITISWLKL